MAALPIRIGIGAIVRVIVQLVPIIRDRARHPPHPASVAGILTGVTLLYITGLLVRARAHPGAGGTALGPGSRQR